MIKCNNMSKTEKRCLNCNSIVEGNYCSKCGQPIDSSRINIKHLMEELQSGIFHINKGLIYTTKELLLRPGSTIRNYISGKRVKYSKPFTFLIIWGAVYSIIFHFFNYFPMTEMNDQSSEVLQYIPLFHWSSINYSLVALFLMPIYAFSSYLLFHRKGYNYTEHLVVFSYIQGATIFLILLCYPLIYLSKSVHVYKVVHAFSEIYVIWALSQFFRTSSWLKVISKVILIIVLTTIFLMILLGIIYVTLRHYDIRL